MNIIKSPFLKAVTTFLILFGLVLVVNFSILQFNMMYPEQPTIYLANQTIHNFSDLVNIYLHPTMLNTNIPFFRPSGHFLIYQILAPILGWKNMKGFFIVSFIFLTLTGYYLIRLYSILFPNYYAGGWIAFCLYLMHPALSLVKLTVMHFDFAYTFLVTLSLYTFALFCKEYKATQHVNKLLFISTLFTYVFAVTFKECAVMLGPVLAAYFIIEMYDSRPILQYAVSGFKQPIYRNIIISLTITTLLLLSYIIAAWPSTGYYVNHIMSKTHSLGTINSFLMDGLGMTQPYFSSGSLSLQQLAWRSIIFSPAARMIMWILCWVCLFSIVKLFLNTKSDEVAYKKSVIFLIIATILFLLIPIAWGTGAPWHYSLTILFISGLMGFGVEYGARTMIKYEKWHALIYAGLPLIIVLIAISVNDDNIHKYEKINNGKLSLSFNRNAVINPPNIKSLLNDKSILVVEDSIMQNDYMMGNAAFPFLVTFNEGDYDRVEMQQRAFYMKFHHLYSGTLFRYAYLMPSLREQVFPFQIEKMDELQNEVIYNWLLHFNNIFAVGYDAEGKWHDKTALFKKNLVHTERQRNLLINDYEIKKVDTRINTASYTTELIDADPQLCRFTCDQDKQCKAYVSDRLSCHIYDKLIIPNSIACHRCVDFNVKTTPYYYQLRNDD